MQISAKAGKDTALIPIICKNAAIYSTTAAVELLTGVKLCDTFVIKTVSRLVSGIENITVGLYAVFDGHGGQEASTFAAEVFHHHFVDHFTQIIESSDVAMIRGIKASQKEGKWTSQGSWSHGSPSLKGDASADAFEASSLFSDEDPERLLPSKSPRDARTNQVYTSIKPSDMGSSFENREVPHKSSEGEREQPGVLNDEARRELIREGTA